jgi:uncharacterized protein YjiS (DUF1127 family)
MNAFIHTNEDAREAHEAMSRFNRIGAPVVRFSRWLRDAGRRNAVINELDRLSDRELADIGLSRGEIRSVFLSSGSTGR